MLRSLHDPLPLALPQRLLMRSAPRWRRGSRTSATSRRRCSRAWSTWRSSRWSGRMQWGVQGVRTRGGMGERVAYAWVRCSGRPAGCVKRLAAAVQALRMPPSGCCAQGMLRESQQASERLQKEYNALSEKVGSGRAFPEEGPALRCRGVLAGDLLGCRSSTAADERSDAQPASNGRPPIPHGNPLEAGCPFATSTCLFAPVPLPGGAAAPHAGGARARQHAAAGRQQPAAGEGGRLWAGGHVHAQPRSTWTLIRRHVLDI